MKAAIGNTLLLSIMVTFMSIVLLVLISSIVYTKAFRVKNRIVDTLETYQNYDEYEESITNEINTSLKEIGYKTNHYSNNTKCNDYLPDNAELVNNSSLYHYCIFKVYSSSRPGGYYYKVAAFAYLDLPLVNALEIPVYGETRMFYGKPVTDSEL